MVLSLWQEKQINQTLEERLKQLKHKIIVLDDDPTGTQTVNRVNVFTNWQRETLLECFKSDASMSFILTNSRSFSVEETTKIHHTIGTDLAMCAQIENKDFLVISRGDSTLRGHYPLETEVLKESIEAHVPYRYDGEIIIPFFEEGGRKTIDNIHYVEVKDSLIPVGETEFAKDKSFGFCASNLLEWCEEKTQGRYQKSEMVSFSLEELHHLDYQALTRKLMGVNNFNKIFVNATSLLDIKIFVIALIDAIKQGKHFMFRTAASFVKVIGGIEDQPLLKKADIVEGNNTNGGIVVVGSHVKKTSQQLEALKNCGLPFTTVEFDVNVIYNREKTKQEIHRIVELTEAALQSGRDVLLYTSRQLIKTYTTNKDEILKTSTNISNALTSIVEQLQVRPKYIIAKGGITSSDVATKGLHIQKAWVLGQIAKGIPIWRTGEESKFPQMAYIIFPGNVGEQDTLKEIVEVLHDYT
ncbi:four-carbon acid sugar kinase family protein [Niameybacter massiliensis]|uniref:four-carbon acid sugar kinase family protein n=1 Tax=Niameybacter massiliensis TaxID=1658108 RepID=UPI0006B5389F|nr:four-carbon acid sugar kinase family protein [Niameybacter massiliensis]